MKILVKEFEIINRKDIHDREVACNSPAFGSRGENCSIEDGGNIENDWAAAGSVTGILAIDLAICTARYDSFGILSHA